MDSKFAKNPTSKFYEDQRDAAFVIDNAYGVV